MCLGVPGRVTAVDEDDGLRMGTVDFGGTSRRICLAYAPEAAIGDYVIVHAGFAISVVDAAEAAATLAALAALDDPELRALHPPSPPPDPRPPPPAPRHALRR